MASRPFLLLKPMPPLRTLVALCVTLTACRPGYRHKLSGELQQALAAGPADRKLRVLVDLTAQLDLAKLSDSLDRRELGRAQRRRSEEHTSELQSLAYLVCRLLLEKKKKTKKYERQN